MWRSVISLVLDFISKYSQNVGFEGRFGHYIWSVSSVTETEGSRNYATLSSYWPRWRTNSSPSMSSLNCSNKGSHWFRFRNQVVMKNEKGKGFNGLSLGFQLRNKRQDGREVCMYSVDCKYDIVVTHLGSLMENKKWAYVGRLGWGHCASRYY